MVVSLGDSQYLFVDKGTGKVVGQVSYDYAETNRPADCACAVRDAEYPNCIVAVVLGQEPRYVEKEPGTQMPRGFTAPCPHSAEDEEV